MSNLLKKKISDRLKIFQTSEKEKCQNVGKREIKVLNETCICKTQVSFKTPPRRRILNETCVYKIQVSFKILPLVVRTRETNLILYLNKTCVL